ncbi:metallophosphoesterase [Xylanimonas ulmi]
MFLGDYIDRGPDSLGVLTTVRGLALRHPERVVALLGNHETDFLEWIDGDDDDLDWLLADLDVGLRTVHSFLGAAPGDDTARALESDRHDVDALASLNAAVKAALTARHGAVIAWLRGRPLVHETDDQIFVHAGIDEAAGESWRLSTPEHVLVSKFPATTGRFVKTIVAGHIATSTLNLDGGHAVHFDGASHYYLDGGVEHTGRLNMLRFDTTTKTYSAFHV